MQAPRLRFDESPLGNERYHSATQRFRKELQGVVTNRIRTLRELLVSDRSKSRQTVIHLEKDGLIWRDDKNVYFHKNPNLKTKRMRMLITLIKNDGATKTALWIKKLDYRDRHILSQEKNRLNILLKKKLGISQDLILGGNERRTKGYELNPAFEVRIEPKSR